MQLVVYLPTFAVFLPFEADTVFEAPDYILRSNSCTSLPSKYTNGNGAQCPRKKYSADLTRSESFTIILLVIGVWRSLVSRLVRVQEASGSNPDTPTKKHRNLNDCGVLLKHKKDCCYGTYIRSRRSQRASGKY